jgi:hypothetical protein
MKRHKLADTLYAMKPLVAGALLCLALAPVSSAHALSTRVFHTPLVAGRNGQAVVFLVSTIGPEGGGSIEFLLATANQQTRFMVSSNFSPGGSSRSQTIPESKCRIAVGRLGASMRRAGIVDFASHPDRCRSRAREHVIYVSEKFAGITPLPIDYVRQSPYQLQGSQSPILVVRGDDLVLYEEHGTTTLPFVMPKAKSVEVRAFLFRGNLILAVVTGDGRSEVLRILQRPAMGEAFRSLQ